MAKPLLLILTLTTLVVAASAAASVTIFNPATIPVSVVVLPAAADHPRDGADYEDVVNVKVSTPASTVMTIVNLTEAEQDIQIQSTTGEGEGHEVEVHVQDGDVLLVIPDADGDGDGGLLLGFKIDILQHKANLHVVPPGPK